MNFNYKTSKKFIKIRPLLLRIKLAADRTARSSAAITIAFINTHILVVLNRAAAFTVQKETGSAAVRLKIIIGFPCVSHSFTFLSIYEWLFLNAHKRKR